MGTLAASVPVAYRHVVRSVPAAQPTPARPQEFTLLELVEAVSEVTQDEREIVAAVMHMLSSGRVRLAGNFRDEALAQFWVD